MTPSIAASAPETTKRNIRLVALDRTRDYSEEIQRRAGPRIWDFFWYDSGSATYCCEITPSRELHYLSSAGEAEYTDDDELREEIFELLLDANCEQEEVCYMHCRAADRLPGTDLLFEGDSDDVSEEAIQEYLQGNDCTCGIKLD